MDNRTSICDPTRNVDERFLCSICLEVSTPDNPVDADPGIENEPVCVDCWNKFDDLRQRLDKGNARRELLLQMNGSV